MKARMRVRLRPRLDEELNDYVNAAKASASTKNLATAAVIGVIGIGSLGLVPAVCGEIVYTPTNESVGKVIFGEGDYSTLQIDLNNDGIPDLVLSAYNLTSFSSHVEIFNSLFVRGLQSNRILNANHGLALDGAPGQQIGPVNANSRFGRGGLMAVFREVYSAFGQGYRMSTGLWLNATNRYLGVRFTINGETHYGWARLTAHAGFANLTGYAYETVPGKPIPAGAFETPPEESGAVPQSGSLGELAQGATRTRGD